MQTAREREDVREQEFQDAGRVAPRVTPDDVDRAIVSEYYHVVAGTTLTLCVLTLRNGYYVTGESASASPENFIEGIGRRLAYEKARAKVWELEGYLLRHKLSDDAVTPAMVKAAKEYAASGNPDGPLAKGLVTEHIARKMLEAAMRA